MSGATWEQFLSDAVRFATEEGVTLERFLERMSFDVGLSVKEFHDNEEEAK